jgi:hypothetical protein
VSKKKIQANPSLLWLKIQILNAEGKMSSSAPTTWAQAHSYVRTNSKAKIRK